MVDARYPCCGRSLDRAALTAVAGIPASSPAYRQRRRLRGCFKTGSRRPCAGRFGPPGPGRPSAYRQRRRLRGCFKTGSRRPCAGRFGHQGPSDRRPRHSRGAEVRRPVTPVAAGLVPAPTGHRGPSHRTAGSPIAWPHMSFETVFSCELRHAELLDFTTGSAPQDL